MVAGSFFDRLRMRSLKKPSRSKDLILSLSKEELPAPVIPDGASRRSEIMA